MSQGLPLPTPDSAPSIEITDDDIQNIALSMGCSFDNEQRRQAIRCLDSCDVQAGPGSGKTTLLVAKLAILSAKWPWRDRGICVLSHTNAARHEVEKRLANHPTAHRLLDYPHFVGTIQTFVDQFLALPFLRGQRKEIVAIDNDRFARSASFLLGAQYQAAHSYLSYRNQLNIAPGLRFEGPDLDLGSANGEINLNPQKPAYKDLKNLKLRLSSEGLFRFDDMYAFGECYLKHNPLMIEYFTTRFPYIFVDEIQDTDEMQNRLLQTLFGTGCVLQRFGDVNQAIFRGEGGDGIGVRFPSEGHISVPDCLRFGERIASIASQFTAVEQQELVGNPERPQRLHTIFLFDDSSIGNVLSSFGGLLLQEYPDGFPAGFVAKAVGGRKSDSETTKIPYAISDYWDGFQPHFSAQTSCPDCLLDFILRARDVLVTHSECHPAYNVLFEGILQFLHIQGARTEADQKFTKFRLFEALKGWEVLEVFQDLLRSLLLGPSLNRERWQEWASTLIRLTEANWQGDLSSGASAFLEWKDPGTVELPEPYIVATNFLRCCFGVS